MTERLSTDPQDRHLAALESLARSFDSIATLLTRVVEREYPNKPEPQDATITRVPSEEDLIKEAQGAGEESLSDWMGLREQEFVESAERKRTRSSKG